MNKKTLRSNRPDGRFQTLGGVVHHRLKNLKPKLAFDPSWSNVEMAAWQSKVRRRLRQILVLTRPLKQPEPKLIHTQQRNGYQLQRWELYPDPESVVPMFMLIPNSATKKQPVGAIICLPGTDHPLERLAGEPEPLGSPPDPFSEHNSMGLHFVKQGLVALCIENPGTGSMGEPLIKDGMRQSLELAWMGQSYEGISVAHKLAAYRWLRKHPLVDAPQIAVCGHSLGGKAALLLGVLEPRLRAVVWNSVAYDHRLSFVHTNLTRIAPWQYVPGFIQWFDYLDLMAALAPMPLMLSEGGRTEELRKVRKAYTIAGAKGCLKVDYTPGLRTTSDRIYDRKPIPEGLTRAEYCLYINAGVDEHRFQADTVVPWIVKTLKNQKNNR